MLKREVVHRTTLALAVVVGVALVFGGCSKKKEDKGEPKKAKDAPAAGLKKKVAAPPATPPPARMAAPAAKAYEVVLNRPIKVGQKFHWKSAGTVDSRLTAGGQVVPSQTMRMTFVFESEIEVLKVNKVGIPQKLTAKVISLKVTEQGKTTSPVAAGTVITAENPNDGKSTFLVKGEPAKGKLQEVLSTAIMVDDDKELDVGAVFGPKGPKKVGDTWKANVAALLTNLKPVLKDPQMWPKPEDVNSSVKLEGLYKVAGVPCMKVIIKATLNKIAPKMGPVKATAGTLVFQVVSMLPLDKKLPGVAAVQKMFFHIEGEVTKEGQTTKIVMDTTRHVKIATKLK
jgi:hypothetical protein